MSGTFSVSVSRAYATRWISCSRTASIPIADGRRPRLELPGDVVEVAPPEVDLADHLAAGQEGRHRLEQLAPSPQRPRAHRAEHLVAAEHADIGAELLAVDPHVRDRLRAIDEDQRARLVGELDHVADLVDRAQRVRH